MKARGLQVRLEGGDELLSKLKPKLVATPVKNFFRTWGVMTSNYAKEGAPVNKGQLRASLTWEYMPMDSLGIPKGVRAGTNVEHAIFMEGGTGTLEDLRAIDNPVGGRKRHWPPPEALEEWARLHGADPFVVARAIGIRGGLKPRRFLRNAYDKSELMIPNLLNVLKSEIEALRAVGGPDV